MTKTPFNPFARPEPDSIELGDIGTFVVGEMVNTRMQRMRDLEASLAGIADDDIDASVRGLCELIEVFLDTADGVAVKLFDRFKNPAEGVTPLSLQDLQRAVEFLRSTVEAAPEKN